MGKNPLIEFPLDLPDVRVLGTETLERGELLIRVESTLRSARCHKCGAETSEFYGYDTPIRLRHLPVLNRRVFIELRPKRFRCPKCNGRPTTTQRCAWYDPRSPHTRAFEQSMLLALVGSTVADVSIKNALGPDAIDGMLERHISAKVAWERFESLGILGIDEIALKKGHRDFVAIVTARMDDESTELLAVLPDRLKETVVAFLRSIPQALAPTVYSVCIDMNEGYANAVREVLPQAKVVVDRFHVAKAYRQGPDQLRKTEQGRLKRKLPKDEYDKLDGAMWAFRKRPEELEHEEKDVLERLLGHSPKLKAAYDLRERLTTIFESDKSKAAASRAIDRWVYDVRRSRLKCFDGFLKTLSNWKDEITNYFLDRHTSGFVEGLNNKIKVIKRRCYGILNVSNLFRRLHLDLRGYALFAT